MSTSGLYCRTVKVGSGRHVTPDLSLLYIWALVRGVACPLFSLPHAGRSSKLERRALGA